MAKRKRAKGRHRGKRRTHDVVKLMMRVGRKRGRRRGVARVTRLRRRGRHIPLHVLRHRMERLARLVLSRSSRGERE